MKAAVVIIGNEILTGKFQDENGPFLIRRLRELGVSLVRLSVIEDDVQAIANEVRRCSEMADVVITTGGVGPTHDDITYAGVAEAFGVPLVQNASMVRIMEGFDLPLHAENLSMATIPKGAVLVRDGAVSFPTVKMNNVYVLPGIPALVRLKFLVIASALEGTPLFTERVYLNATESEVAGPLNEVVAAHPTVVLGSYPRAGQAQYKVLITLESVDESALNLCKHALEASLPGVVHL